MSALDFIVLAGHFTFALLFTCLTAATCQSDSDGESSEAVEEASDIGIVGEEDSQDFGEVNFGPAPGVDTVCVFPKNSARSKCFFFDSHTFLISIIDIEVHAFHCSCACW